MEKSLNAVCMVMPVAESRHEIDVFRATALARGITQYFVGGQTDTVDEALQRGMADALLFVLQGSFGNLSEETYRVVRTGNLAELDAWMMGVLEAHSPDLPRVLH